jgi:hypothetical protein
MASSRARSSEGVERALQKGSERIGHLVGHRPYLGVE